MVPLTCAPARCIVRRGVRSSLCSRQGLDHLEDVLRVLHQNRRLMGRRDGGSQFRLIPRVRRVVKVGVTALVGSMDDSSTQEVLPPENPRRFIPRSLAKREDNGRLRPSATEYEC